jgi:hypothetical protein
MKLTQLITAALVTMQCSAFAQLDKANQQVVLPEGTHILLELVSPLHTTSATEGSAAYLQTVMPVIANNRVVIPEHTRVTGTVVKERRPGRARGRAQLRISFTDLIFADNHVLPITGMIQGLPGSSRNRKVDAEGTIEPVDQIDRDVRGVVFGALPGTVLGLLGAGGPGIKLAFVGGGLGLGKALATRGEEISLPEGTKVEMVLQHPLQIDGV